MFRDELDVLEMRLTELAKYTHVMRHVLVESHTTHLGVPKPLHYRDHCDEFSQWSDRVHAVTFDDDEQPMDAWEFEHAQRNAAWAYVDAHADGGDVVFICDVDEIPSKAMISWLGDEATAVQMRTCIFAVDWEVSRQLPPTCVIASVAYLRLMASYGLGLAEVRDRRDQYPVLEDGGWHLSWLGGPERQREKLVTATCHQEVLATPEAALIASGARWATSEDGGGLPVKPVDVDETWPAYVYERRCPVSWFRPRVESRP
jgi:hypothetical protein